MNVQTTVRVYDREATLEHVANYRKGIAPTYQCREYDRSRARLISYAAIFGAVIVTAAFLVGRSW